MTVSIAPIREFLWVVKESALGTPMASPTAGTDSIFIHLVEGNSFDMTAKPLKIKLPYGGGFAVTRQTISDRYELKGNLKTKLYPSQAQMLLDWATTRITSVPAPWTTSEIIGDLASCSLFHGYTQNNTAFLKKQYGGCKVGSAGIEIGTEATVASLTMGLQAATVTAFGTNSGDPTTTLPTEADYPSGPYSFVGTAGLLSIASTRTNYSSLSIKFENKLDPQWYETAGLSTLGCYGRDSTLEAMIRLKPSPDDRIAYELLTAQAVSVGLVGGGHTLTLTYNGQNITDDYARDLALGKAFSAKLSLLNQWDPAANSGAGGDFSFAIA
jgi:hypothetical protein